MTDFIDQDLSGARFEAVDLTGARVRGSLLRGVRMSGVELIDVEISGELERVVVNGVDVAPLVEAELDRRDPERALMRPDDAAGFRRAWEVLERRWAETVARARGLPATALHQRVGEEWSFVETLRHLGFATAAWIERTVLGDPAPWHPLDLPWDEAPGWPDIPWDREVRPSLDEVLALRARRQHVVRHLLADLTDEQLAGSVTRPAPGWPELDDFPVREALLIVLNEEWHHRLFAERDLTALGAPAPTPRPSSTSSTSSTTRES